MVWDVTQLKTKNLWLVRKWLLGTIMKELEGEH